MFQTKDVETIKTDILYSITFFGYLSVYEKMCKIFVEPDSPQKTIWRRRIECWILKATKAHL